MTAIIVNIWSQKETGIIANAFGTATSKFITTAAAAFGIFGNAAKVKIVMFIKFVAVLFIATTASLAADNDVCSVGEISYRTKYTRHMIPNDRNVS